MIIDVKKQNGLNMIKSHSFHIPVLGIGFSIDTPLKVSRYGIDSVISLVDDLLLEKMRRMYCEKHGLPYEEITHKNKDFRAKRITAYLNLINDLSVRKFEELKNGPVDEDETLRKYLEMLPGNSSIRKDYDRLTAEGADPFEALKRMQESLYMGSIDVNIMTKIDKENYCNGEKLPLEYNDAFAALRGYAESNLASSIILSAGMNQRLYGYFEQFEDFFPDEEGAIKKKIVLKVSDYRSAFIQGKFLAKKGLWVSEYRVESGLNCGGHAFATDGYLLGPILAEFRDRRDELLQPTYKILVKALTNRKRPIPKGELPFKVTAQGGVGTAEEHQFLLDHYHLDSVGWGTPFLLVPEVANVDRLTLQQLMEAKEEDLFLSNISPLGVPFNSLRQSSKEAEKDALIAAGKPGSPCPRRYAISNNEFTEKPICIASRQYQGLKIKELEKEELPPAEYQSRFQKIVDKSCICLGLVTSTLLVNDLDRKVEGEGVSVCPGPNLAYFSRIMTLKEMVDHIYGRANMIPRTDRPNMFVKELNIYIDYLKNRIEETRFSMTDRQAAYLLAFEKNLNDGISYYQKMFGQLKDTFQSTKATILKDLEECRESLHRLRSEIESL